MNTERNIELLKFIKERLVSVYGEHPNTDFVLGLDRVINETSELEILTNENKALSQKLRSSHHVVETTQSALKRVSDYVGRLENYNSALAAQVGILKRHLIKCAELVNFDAGTAIDWLIDNHHNLLNQANKAPSQHLRELRAEAIEEALDYMYSNTSSGNSAGDDFDLIREYADSIRQEKEHE